MIKDIVVPTIGCTDCKTPLTGSLNVSSQSGAGIAWMCPACVLKYPSQDAAKSRLTDVSLRAMHKMVEGTDHPGPRSTTAERAAP